MAPSPTLQSMRSSSPGRARSTSMREGYVGRREPSPMRGGMFAEPRAQSALQERNVSEPRRDGVFASPQYPRESPHSFRAFRPDQQEQRGPPTNGVASMGRPLSQPVELAGPRSVEEIIAHRDVPGEGRFGTFRQFAEPAAPLQRVDITPRQEVHPFPIPTTSQPRDRDVFGSPRTDRDMRLGQMRFQPGGFGTPMREDQAGLFRPALQHAPDTARESIEARALYEMRREEPRSSPPMSDAPMYPPYARTGFIDRPMTWEEHQRMETIHREQHRVESDASSHRTLLGISPELNRKGRNSPLPQAVQGAQPRHVGPGGDNPGIKMEFGRMFSGLGSGVGSATPTAAHSVNGATTPSRLSPSRQYDECHFVSSAISNIEDWKTGTTTAKSTKRNVPPSRDDERFDIDNRAAPDAQRGNKRNKTAHPAHHHHHHVHSHHHHHHPHEQEALQGSFSMLRSPSNQGPAPTSAAAAHHHHHHHATHSHPAHHHHHHPPRPMPAPRKPTVTIVSTKVIDEVASKPRQHLGSQLYTTELLQSPNADTSLDANIKFVSKMKPIPLFEGKENCTYTVRVPRYYFKTSQQSGPDKEPSALEEICKRGQLWGTEVYTDDSDVVAAAVHSKWLKGDFGKYNDDVSDDEFEAGDLPEDEDVIATPSTLLAKPTKPVQPLVEFPDVHITVLVLPALESYASTTSNHVLSKEWKKPHDGLSFMIHRIDFVDEGAAGRYTERGITARKQRIAIEEAKRREAAAGLLMFATGQTGGVVSVGA
ncbi:hypothetical protein LTR08_000398 [Meristemomyces frigidus]|nr:hypothetical protein LTR08_000398 [Meristemomyces frigidus]